MPGVTIHTKEDAYRLFDEAVTALTTTNFIITEKPITDLLRCLVYCDELRLFIIDCKKGVDYETELATAVTEAEGGGYLFILPKSNKRIIALVTGLLHDFDTGVRSLTSFIQNFWPNVDNNTRYRYFCESILLPYREAFRASFLGETTDAEQPESDRNFTISDSVLENAAPLFSALRTVFAGDNKLTERKREALISLTDGLYYALEKGDCRIVKTVWTGLWLALDGNKKAERKFSDISEFLALYSLI